MDKFLWLCFIVPVMAAGMVLHLKMKGQVKAAGYDQHSGSVTLGQQMWYIIPKCLSTWMAVFTAAAGLWQQKTDTYEHAWWILAALILFMAADAFLEIKFYIGMAVFAAGHLILIAWIFSFGYFNIAGTLIIWCLLIRTSDTVFNDALSGRACSHYCRCGTHAAGHGNGFYAAGHWHDSFWYFRYACRQKFLFTAWKRYELCHFNPLLFRHRMYCPDDVDVTVSLRWLLFSC